MCFTEQRRILPVTRQFYIIRCTNRQRNNCLSNIANLHTFYSFARGRPNSLARQAVRTATIVLITIAIIVIIMTTTPTMTTTTTTTTTTQQRNQCITVAQTKTKSTTTRPKRLKDISPISSSQSRSLWRPLMSPFGPTTAFISIPTSEKHRVQVYLTPGNQLPVFCGFLQFPKIYVKRH